MGRGRLRVYLGVAPGVGATSALLAEGQRLARRGVDVVVAFAETRGRVDVAAYLDGLEVLARRSVDRHDTLFEDVDVAAVLARAPRLALVDELARPNVPGSGNASRWQDVRDLLEAGVDVATTLRIDQVESLADAVADLTGTTPRECVPEEILRSAERIELVDGTPGPVSADPDTGSAAGSAAGSPAVLAALRELALLWLADRVGEEARRHRKSRDQARPEQARGWPTRERVVVALTGGAFGRALIRRAARIAGQAAGGELMALHVARPDDLTGADPAELASQRRLVESLGGSYHQVIDDDVAAAVLAFARARDATQIVLEAGRPFRPWLPSVGQRVVRRTMRDAGGVDVHVVGAVAPDRRPGLPRLGGSLTARRRVQGFTSVAVLLPLLTFALVRDRGHLNLGADMLAFLLAVVVVALVGGLYPALLAAVTGSLLLNYYFTPPLHRFTVSETNNVLALVAYVIVAALVSSVVDLAARRTRQAARASAESETLATMAGSILRGERALPALLERVREAFAMEGVSLLEREPSRGPAAGWRVVSAAGGGPDTPEQAEVSVEVGERLVLALAGHRLREEDRRVLGAFASHVAVALEQRRLTEAAEAAKPIAEADRMRTALLAAVSHDLRTPLASAKAAVTSLRSRDVTWGPAERDELLVTADESLDRLARLVNNLLDMSRLQAGALSLFPRSTGVDEVVAGALDDLGPPAKAVRVDLPADLPEVRVDPSILERVVVNLVANALRYSPPGREPRVTASGAGGCVELRVVDRGPGIAPEKRDRVFVPFQRLGDTDNTTGVGLGLALSRGLTEAMGGTLVPEETPGGGLTMTVSLPAVPSSAAGVVRPGLREAGEAAPDAGTDAAPGAGANADTDAAPGAGTDASPDMGRGEQGG